MDKNSEQHHDPNSIYRDIQERNCNANMATDCLKKQLFHKNSLVDKLRDILHKSRKENSLLSDKLKEKDDQIRQFQTKMDNLSISRVLKEQPPQFIVNDSQELKDISKAVISDLEKVLAMRQGQIADLEINIKEFKDQIQTQKAETLAASEENVNLVKETNKLRQEIIQRDKVNCDLRKEIDRLGALPDHSNLILRIQKENRSVKALLKASRVEKETLKLGLEKITKEVKGFIPNVGNENNDFETHLITLENKLKRNHELLIGKTRVPLPQPPAAVLYPLVPPQKEQS